MPKHPPLSHHIHARVDKSTKDYLHNQAQNLNLSISDLLREIIEQDKKKKEQEEVK